MSDQSDKPEEGATAEDAAQEGPEPADAAVAEPQLVNPDEVQLSESEVSREALEPELETSAEDVQLSEPSLGAAEISQESAEAASLKDAAAEAKAVEQEAEEVGTLVGGPRPPEDPAEAAAPAGTAPAGGTAGDTGENRHDDGGHSGDQHDDGAQNQDVDISASDDDPIGAVAHQPDEATPAQADPAAPDAHPEPKSEPRASTDPQFALANLAASGEDPGWTGSTEDGSRWDALFELGEAEAAAAPGTTAGNAAVSENVAGAAEQQGADITLPPGIPAPPEGAPGNGDTPAPPAGATGNDETPAAQGSTETPSSQDGHEAPAAQDIQTPSAQGTPAEQVPESPWKQPFAGPHPQAPGSPHAPLGGAYGLPPAGAEQGTTAQDSSRDRTGKSGTNRRTLIIVAVAGLVILGLLIFAIIRIVDAVSGGGPDAAPSVDASPGADGIIAESISPLELGAGACILDFDESNLSENVTTVTCTTPHNAQLLATDTYPEDTEFPGDEALAVRGDELCNSAEVDERAATEYPDLTLIQVTPTSGTWAEGDRRVDCFVVSNEGNIITDDLLAQ
ncbi:hypothetical protein BJ994_002532 [Arthrobacter pigmenti]|uniref:Septum formation-related domain-containing protein n=1 Tax=Arthrobacter pigmenti TaxID=271432 RepID=A0A846RWQ8_9MICC|nr:septum formation family protein [Arthrobacter pigmenti]NJC23456.1 hypothetical protein [Arthrobacter pigmenti]